MTAGGSAAENPQFFNRNRVAGQFFKAPVESLRNRVIDQPGEDETVAGCTGRPRRCMVGFADTFLRVDGTAAIIEDWLARAECMEG